MVANTKPVSWYFLEGAVSAMRGWGAVSGIDAASAECYCASPPHPDWGSVSAGRVLLNFIEAVNWRRQSMM